jgi:putative oxidoreductase
LISSGSMAYAYFTVHQETNLWPIQNGGELSALFCWSLLLIVMFGPGKFAVDAFLPRRTATAAPAPVSTSGSESAPEPAPHPLTTR